MRFENLPVYLAMADAGRDLWGLEGPIKSESDEFELIFLNAEKRACEESIQRLEQRLE